MKLKVSKKQKKDLKLSLKYFAFFCIGMIAMLGLMWFFVVTTATSVHTNVGCDGVDLFYSGKSFLWDTGNIIGAQNGLMGYPAYTPRVLNETGMGDCSTISNAIYCLGQLYDIPCSFYTVLKYDPVEKDTNWVDNAGWQEQLGFIGHMGVKCYIAGQWRELY